MREPIDPSAIIILFLFAGFAMFESLSQRLATTVNRLRGRGRLTDENIREALREVRIALLEADVALPVVQALIQRIKVRAVGQEVARSLSPGQALVKVVSDELTMVMGIANTELNLAQQPPAVVLMAGLQGAGKTTTVAKLARLLTERKKKKVKLRDRNILVRMECGEKAPLKLTFEVRNESKQFDHVHLTLLDGLTIESAEHVAIGKR